MPLSASDFNDLQQIYQEENDSLIDNLGKPILLIFKQTVDSDIDNSDDIDDNVRGESFRKPSYKANVPVVTETTREIKGLIVFDPSDFKRMGNRIDIPDNILRIKTYITEIQYLTSCDYLIPNYNVSGHIYSKYKLFREPFPIGLKNDRYCISYWERINGNS